MKMKATIVVGLAVLACVVLAVDSDITTDTSEEEFDQDDEIPTVTLPESLSNEANAGPTVHRFRLSPEAVDRIAPDDFQLHDDTVVVPHQEHLAPDYQIEDGDEDEEDELDSFDDSAEEDANGSLQMLGTADINKPQVIHVNEEVARQHGMDQVGAVLYGGHPTRQLLHRVTDIERDGTGLVHVHARRLSIADAFRRFNLDIRDDNDLIADDDDEEEEENESESDGWSPDDSTDEDDVVTATDTDSEMETESDDEMGRGRRSVPLPGAAAGPPRRGGASMNTGRVNPNLVFSPEAARARAEYEQRYGTRGMGNVHVAWSGGPSRLTFRTVVQLEEFTVQPVFRSRLVPPTTLRITEQGLQRLDLGLNATVGLEVTLRARVNQAVRFESGQRQIGPTVPLGTISFTVPLGAVPLPVYINIRVKLKRSFRFEAAVGFRFSYTYRRYKSIEPRITYTRGRNPASDSCWQRTLSQADWGNNGGQAALTGASGRIAFAPRIDFNFNFLFYGLVGPFLQCRFSLPLSFGIAPARRWQLRLQFQVFFGVKIDPEWWRINRTLEVKFELFAHYFVIAQGALPGSGPVPTSSDRLSRPALPPGRPTTRAPAHMRRNRPDVRRR